MATAALSAATAFAVAASFAFFFAVLFLFVVVMMAAATSAVAVLMLWKDSLRVALDQGGNFVKHGGVFPHLVCQCGVLFPDRPKETSGIPEKLRGKLGVSRHVFKKPFCKNDRCFLRITFPAFS